MTRSLRGKEQQGRQCRFAPVKVPDGSEAVTGVPSF